MPHVEAGTVILVGATTENPSFEVNAPLLSRAKVVVLKPLSEDDLRAIIDRALADAERGLGARAHRLPDASATSSSREARRRCPAGAVTLESAAAIAAPDADGQSRSSTRKTSRRPCSARRCSTTRRGDEHYKVVSAFIKSMRGSDPDAAVYWMARMLEAGEDPLFVLRRMVIFAAEDIGNADPSALRVAMAATDARSLRRLARGHPAA